MLPGDSWGNSRTSYSFAEYQAARRAIEGASVEVDMFGCKIHLISDETKQNALNVLNCLETTTRAPEIIPNQNGTLSLGWATDQGIGHLEIDRAFYRFYVKPINSLPVEDHGEIGKVESTVGWVLGALLYPNLTSPLASVKVRSVPLVYFSPEDLRETRQTFRTLENTVTGSTMLAVGKTSNIEFIPAFTLLEDTYTIDRRSGVERFIEENKLFDILMRARSQINKAFGSTTVKNLTLVEDDEGVPTLFCLVMITGDMQEARRALKAFDHEWWIRESPSFCGKLNFDFELI